MEALRLAIQWVRYLNKYIIKNRGAISASVHFSRSRIQADYERQNASPLSGFEDRLCSSDTLYTHDVYSRDYEKKNATLSQQLNDEWNEPLHERIFQNIAVITVQW